MSDKQLDQLLGQYVRVYRFSKDEIVTYVSVGGILRNSVNGEYTVFEFLPNGDYSNNQISFKSGNVDKIEGEKNRGNVHRVIKLQS